MFPAAQERIYLTHSVGCDTGKQVICVIFL